MAGGAPPVPDEVKARQRRASEPDVSAWVRANAGAGKTYVLARRVLRLLLAGADPARILCITYTRAAAAEMANRVFEWLSRWTTMSEAELAAALKELQGRPATEAEMIRARRLFAAAIETPGRLRIQTIHAFCERLLQQFPFEASVTAGFSVIDERASAELLAEARTAVLRGADDGSLERDLERLAAQAGEETLTKLLHAVVARKGELRAWLHGADDEAHAFAELAAALGLEPGQDEAAITAEILSGVNLPRSEWPAVADLLEAGGKTDRDQAGWFRQAMSAPDTESALAAYLAIFLTGAGDPRNSLVTKAVSDREPALAERLAIEQMRVAACCDKLRAARVLASSAALFRVADAVIGRYEHLKGNRGFLDYDDLIEKASMLLTRLDAGWVLFKLDGGLDHVLVDEAQDTSPRQWTVIGAIVSEFFAGKGARERTRTLFAVGDAKQSIYSFQGAAPDSFDAMRKDFSRTVGIGSTEFADVRLQLSFRSTAAVLAAVDRTFETTPASAGLVVPGDDRPEPHSALRAGQYGRVEVWDVVAPLPHPEPTPWDAPFDVERPDSPPARLAARIARTIRHWLNTREPLEATGQPIRPGDIMILVRNRNPFAAPMIRALKEHGIPVAGADRMVLTEHIAVMDLMSLARFCLTPEDDLNLAALLKSPLIGFSEDALMQVAIGRRGGLWEALRGMAGAPFEAAAGRLAAWLGRAGYERPYEFFARVLGPEGMRAAFHRRLGEEAFEALDEFLSLSLAYERVETPSLAGFLAWLEAAPSEVKRDMDKGRDEVRVLTVHGAKGLEAPIVFLPDTLRSPTAKAVGPIFRFPEPEGSAPLVWVARKSADCEVTQNLRAAAVERQIEEEHRLLYVAMTRARDRLYICGYRTSESEPQGCWYALVRGALEAHLVETTDAGGEIVYRLESGAAADRTAPEPRSDERHDLPPWVDAKAVRERQPARAAPSRLAGRAPSGGRAGAAVRRAALTRGRILHRLLESLPEVAPAGRADAGMRALSVLARDASEADRRAMLEEALAVLDHPAFCEAFAPGARAEVAVAGTVEGVEGRLVGQIDRLAVTESQVLIVDYKTDRVVPAGAAGVPEAYVAQLAAYRRLVEKLHPGKRIRTAILWTAAPKLMEIEAELHEPHGRSAFA